MASCSRLHPQRSFCRRATLPCDHDKAAGGTILLCGDDKAAGGPFFPATTIKQQAGSSSLRPRQNNRRAILPCDNDKAAGGPFYFAAKKNRIGRGTVAATTCRRRDVILAGTMVLHRFLISSSNLRIDAAKRSKKGQSVHRFLISSPDLRIDVAPGLILGQSLQPKGGRHCSAAGECRMGRDFGRRSRPWLRER